MTFPAQKTKLTDTAYAKAKEAVHTVMKTKVELARNGSLLRQVDEYLTQAAAELGTLVLAYDPMDGLKFMMEIANTYRPLLQAAGEEARAELLALEAEEFANRPQD